jgi:hypothetical protein
MQRTCHQINPQRAGVSLEPISKSLEEDYQASELDEAEEVLWVILPSDAPLLSCKPLQSWTNASGRAVFSMRLYLG